MRERHYTILLREDRKQGGYWVTVPALPGILTQGDTLEEAIVHAKEAISLHLRGMIADGDQLPEDEEGTQSLVVKVAA